MSATEEALELAARLNAKHGSDGRIVAHPDVIVDPTFNCPDATRLREIQTGRIRDHKTVPALKRGSG